MEIFSAVVVTLFIAAAFISYSLKSLLKVATPNQVLVLAGSKRVVGDRTVGYRAIRGGRGLDVGLREVNRDELWLCHHGSRSTARTGEASAPSIRSGSAHKV